MNVKQLTDQLLYDLRCMQWLHDGYPSAVYADSLLRTMQELFNQAPDEPLTKILIVFHNALALQNHWINYKPEQYQGAYTLLEDLLNQPSLSQKEVKQAMQELERLGFNTLLNSATGITDKKH